MNQSWIKPLFIVAGLYDAVLGLAFLVAPGRLFDAFDVAPPSHMAYVQFPALLLLLFAAMFFQIAANPTARRELMLYGCGLKIAYCATVIWDQNSTGVPSMWVPWAWADLVFLVLFVMAWRVTAPAADART